MNASRRGPSEIKLSNCDIHDFMNFCDYAFGKEPEVPPVTLDDALRHFATNAAQSLKDYSPSPKSPYSKETFIIIHMSHFDDTESVYGVSSDSIEVYKNLFHSILEC